MAENADNDSLSPTRVARRAPSKRRASSASSDGESKLASAAQSASESIPQSTPPFAHPGEPLRDESTLDLFAGDPLHAPVHAAQTDHRRGRLELQGPSTDEAEQAATTTEGTGPAVAVSHDGGQAEIVIDAVPRDDGVAREVAATPEAAATVDVERAAAPTASPSPTT